MIAKGEWSEKTASLRDELRFNGAASFTSNHIAEDSTKCIQVFQKMHLHEDRPTKRRKTLHESSEDANITAYHELTLLLNGSSEDSPILTLAGLHQIIEYVLSLSLTKL